jgi:pimeloyl-ACP methyl ester carboxylesterase
VREEALSFGDGNRLFGILTEGEEAGGGRTGIVFLNAGANHRVGPNRLYVSLGRDLAARGYPAFRFDVGGLGDGGPAPGMTENQIYSKNSVADVKAAMTFLTSIRGVERFVLVGICSGGFLAFHTSAEDARVAGQIVINPQTFEWKKGDPLEPSVKKGYKSTRYYLQALWRPRLWTLALRGQLDLRGVAGALRNRSAARATARLKGLVARWRGLPEARNEVERVFRSVSDRGVRSLLVFSSNDGGLDMIEQHLGSGASRMRRDTNVRLEIVDGADHTFTQSEAQNRLTTLITRFVEASWPTDSSKLGVRPFGMTCALLHTSKTPERNPSLCSPYPISSTCEPREVRAGPSSHLAKSGCLSFGAIATPCSEPGATRSFSSTHASECFSSGRRMSPTNRPG